MHKRVGLKGAKMKFLQRLTLQADFSMGDENYRHPTLS
jgi:hypothetical protein